MVEVDLPNAPAPLKVKSEELDNPLELETIDQLVIGRGTNEGELVYATEMGINFIDEEGIVVGFDEPDREIAGAELIQPAEISFSWFVVDNQNANSVQDGQYYFNPAPNAPGFRMFKVIQTKYSGPIGNGEILIKRIGDGKSASVETLSEQWFVEYGHEISVVEKISEETTVVPP